MSAQLQVTGEAKIRDIQGPVVANSGVITALDGAASQYVRGDGTLADFPTSSGGGSSVSYYLNSSVSQGTIGGVAYRELSKDPIIGAGTDIPISSNGYVANYITDVNDPDVVLVPGGNFNCEFYFSVNNNTGNPTTYAELYKYDGTTFTLLGTSAGVPESINQGTTIAPYYFAIPVATAALSVTDRLAIRIYVNVDSRTVTLHTENGHLCQVVTTLSKGMVSLNNLTDQSQYLATGTSGTDFNIVSSGDTHTFNIPSASASNRGLITIGSQTIAGAKTFSNNVNINSQLFIFGGTGYGGGVSYRQGGILSTSDGSTTTEFPDANSIKYYVGQGSNTYKNFIFDVNNITLNATRTYNLPDLSGTLALLEAENNFTLVNSFDQSINYKTDAVLVGISGYISQAYAKSGSGASSILSMKIADGSSVKNISLDFIGSPVSTPYSYLFPAFSGTMALLEGTQTFTGDKIFNGALDFNNSININSGIFIRNNAVGSTLYTNFSITKASNIQTLSYLFSTGFASRLLFNDAASYSYTFPTSSGTVALTSNLSSYVPYTGATANVDLGTNSISSSFIYANGVSGLAGSIYLKQTTSIQDSSSGYSSMSAFGASSLHFSLNNGTLNRRFRINSVNLDGTNIRTYLLPDADGTLALTSNLSAYLPLTGGTLTGALSGTSATFSSTVRPASNLGSDLGTSSFRWAEMWGYTLNLNGGSTIQSRLTLARGSDDSSQNALYGWNSIIVQRTSVPLSSPQTEFSIIQQGSDGSRTPFNISTTGAATFSSSVFVGSSITSAATLHVNNLASGDPTSLSSVPTTNVFGMSTSPGAMLAAGIGTNGGSHVWLQGRNTGGAGVSYPISLQPLGGNVGIGTSSPLNLGSATNTVVTVNAATGNSAAYALTINNVEQGYISTQSSSMAIVNSANTPMIFATNNAERMRITSAGNVLIGTSSSVYSTAAKMEIQYSGASLYGINMRTTTGDAIHLNFVNQSGSQVGYIYSNNTNTQYTTSSDYRLKQDLKDYNGLSLISQIKTYDYEWKINKTRSYGVLAHELSEVLPDAVSGKKDGERMQGVDYSKIVPVLVKAIQELEARIKQLENK